MEPLTNETVQISGWKNTGCVASWQLQNELKPSTALVAASPATTTTGTFRDRRALWERKLNTLIAISTATTIAMVVDDPGWPNHPNQFGSQVTAEGRAARMHSHPSSIRATAKSAVCTEREGATVRCIRPSFLLGVQ
jgi:hypothetical protein